LKTLIIYDMSPYTSISLLEINLIGFNFFID